MSLNDTLLMIVTTLCLYVVEWIKVTVPDIEDSCCINSKVDHIQDDIILQQLSRKRKW